MHYSGVNKYSYSPYGVVDGRLELQPQPFTYVGQFGVMDEGNGVYYMRARYYDPSVGRFISEDPIGFGGGDVNLYSYALNNPINFIDPEGLCRWPNFDESIIPPNNKGGSPLIDSAILLCMIARESHFNPSAGIGTNNSGKGLLGVTVAAATSVGYINWGSNVGNAAWNIQVGSGYLGSLLGDGANVATALQGYRMGPNSTDPNGTGARYAQAIQDCAECVRNKKNCECKDDCYDNTLGKGL